jgi:hypothetical protein
MPEITIPTPQAETDSRPAYETPRIQVMTEREILNTFQITQAMVSWWGAC